jgi:FecR protein
MARQCWCTPGTAFPENRAFIPMKHARLIIRHIWQNLKCFARRIRMKPFGHLAVAFLAICTAFFPTSLAAATAKTASPTEPQLVRVSYMQGDVRFNRGDAKQPNLKKPWERADVNLPIMGNYALATGGDGRAEIEFERGSVIYVAENSVVLFEELTSTNGTPLTRLELVSGTITTGIKPVPGELFAIGISEGELRISYPQSSFVRVDSYLDGMAFTPQDKSGFDFVQIPAKVHVAQGQTLTYEDGQAPRLSGSAQANAPSEWDRWVTARYEARDTAMQAALKASGLLSPIPGLTDMYASGTFSACAPYGMCWEPSEKAMMPPTATSQARPQQAEAEQAPELHAASEQASSEKISARQAAPQSTTAQTSGASPGGYRSCPRRLRSGRWWMTARTHRGTRGMWWRRGRKSTARSPRKPICGDCARVGAGRFATMRDGFIGIIAITLWFGRGGRTIPFTG